MASIKISELRPAGFDLFQDSESFLNELGDREMLVAGSGGSNQYISAISQVSKSVGISIVTASVVSQVKTWNYITK